MATGSDDAAGSSDRQGLRSFLESAVERAGSGVGRLREAALELKGSPALSQGLAARERGNLEAAFWLLNEAFGEDPDAQDVAVHYWNVALDLGRVEIASNAGVRLVESHASAGESDLAAQYWLELIGAARDVMVSSGAIATILPELKRRLQNANEEEALALRGHLRRAMRHAVDPRNGPLHPGVAMRVFEVGRELNPEAARRAAEVALQSPNLHEAKRARLQEALTADAVAGSEPAPPASPSPPTPEPVAVPEAAPIVADAPPAKVQPFDLIEAQPLELGVDAIVVCTKDGLELPILYEGIEAIAVADVAGLADENVTLVDLVRRSSSAPDGGSRSVVVRLRADSFEPGALVPGPCLEGAELAAFLGELLERSRATPMPDLESALGVQVACFESVAAYEQQVLVED
jgi:hypothetical protein